MKNEIIIKSPLYYMEFKDETDICNSCVHKYVNHTPEKPCKHVSFGGFVIPITKCANYERRKNS